MCRRYLRDLLENHAPELKQQAERVEELHKRFDTLRQQFCDEFDYGPEATYEGFSLKPQDYLSLWVFEYLTRLEREDIDGFAELREWMINDVGKTM